MQSSRGRTKVQREPRIPSQHPLRSFSPRRRARPRDITINSLLVAWFWSKMSIQNPLTLELPPPALPTHTPSLPRFSSKQVQLSAVLVQPLQRILTRSVPPNAVIELTTSVPTVVAEFAGMGRLPVEARVVPVAGEGTTEEEARMVVASALREPEESMEVERSEEVAGVAVAAANALEEAMGAAVEE